MIGRMLIPASLSLLAVVIVLSGCGGPPQVSDEDVQRLLYAKLVEMLEAEGKREPILVDVRMSARYAKGHLPGAINITVVDLRADHPKLAGKRPIILCSDGWSAVIGHDDGLSSAAAKKLITAGYDADRVFDFRGGVDKWVKQGGQLSTD